VWTAPSWQEIFLRGARIGVAVLCPAFGCGSSRPLALMESARHAPISVAHSKCEALNGFAAFWIDPLRSRGHHLLQAEWLFRFSQDIQAAR
jgi:hypothetical protein